MAYHIYDTGTGRIDRTFMSDDLVTLDQQIQAGEDAIAAPAGTRDDTHYVLDGEVLPRPATPPTHYDRAIDADLDLADLPAGTAITVSSGIAVLAERLTLDAPGFTISFIEPGFYSMEIQRPFPAQAETVTIEVS